MEVVYLSSPSEFSLDGLHPPQAQDRPCNLEAGCAVQESLGGHVDSQAKKEEPRGLSRVISILLVIVNGSHHILGSLRVTGPSRQIGL